MTNTPNPIQQKSQNKGAFHYDYFVLSANSLVNLLQEEIKYIKANAVDDLMKLQDKKIELANFLERQQKSLIKSPAILDNLTAFQKEELKKLAKSLAEVSKLNIKALDSVRYYLETLMKVARKVIKNKGSDLNTYTNKGLKDDRHLKVMAPSVTLSSEI